MVITAVDGQVPGDIKSFAKMLNEKKRGEGVVLNLLIPQRAGCWARGTAELALR